MLLASLVSLFISGALFQFVEMSCDIIMKCVSGASYSSFASVSKLRVKVRWHAIVCKKGVFHV